LLINNNYFILLNLSLFFIGLFGIIIHQTNLLVILLCLELIILACALNFIYISKFFNEEKGQIFALLLLIISAAETAFGLGLIIRIHKTYKVSNITYFNRFRY
jgi:NADH-quinone oxidoreductase subunit K